MAALWTKIPLSAQIKQRNISQMLLSHKHAEMRGSYQSQSFPALYKSRPGPGQVRSSEASFPEDPEESTTPVTAADLVLQLCHRAHHLLLHHTMLLWLHL